MKKANKRLIISFVIALAVIFALVAGISAKVAYDKRIQSEKLSELDFYSMQQFSNENSEAVMDALKAGNKSKLEKLMIKSTGIDDVLAFADWGKAKFKKAVSHGAGSLTAAPDESGKMDISERFVVEIGDAQYVLFIETLTSRWGRENDGVSAIGVTTYEHFKETDSDWNGEADEKSALAGETWWNK